MALVTVDVVVRGDAPLLLNNGRTADPLDPFTIKLQTFTQKRKKTSDDHRAIQRIQWEASMHYSDELGVVLPASMLHSTLIAGAKVTKQGRQVTRGVRGTQFEVPVTYDGPRDVEGLWNDKKRRFVDVRRVVRNGRTSVMQARFRLPVGWSVAFTNVIDTHILDLRDYKSIVGAAGRYAGFGSYRPGSPSGGLFGTFGVEKFEAHKAAA